jgi:hypothetical protein
VVKAGCVEHVVPMAVERYIKHFDDKGELEWPYKNQNDDEMIIKKNVLQQAAGRDWLGSVSSDGVEHSGSATRTLQPLRHAHPSKKKNLILMDKTRQTPWPLARERTIPTERPPLVDEI